jgi:hypothetical protein
VGVVLSLLTDNIYQQTTFADGYIFHWQMSLFPTENLSAHFILGKKNSSAHGVSINSICYHTVINSFLDHVPAIHDLAIQ